MQEGDEFLFIACDGIWDVYSSQQVCVFDFSRSQHVCVHQISFTHAGVCASLPLKCQLKEGIFLIMRMRTYIILGTSKFITLLCACIRDACSLCKSIPCTQNHMRRLIITRPCTLVRAHVCKDRYTSVCTHTVQAWQCVLTLFSACEQGTQIIADDGLEVSPEKPL